MMETRTKNRPFFERFDRATREHICPECGQKMKVTHRSVENSSVFVWYECPYKQCQGQWLQRYPRNSLDF